MVALAEALVLSAWLASGAVAARTAAPAMMEVRYFFILLSFSIYPCCKPDLALRSRAARFEQEILFVYLGSGHGKGVLALACEPNAPPRERLTEAPVSNHNEGFTPFPTPLPLALS